MSKITYSTLSFGDSVMLVWMMIYIGAIQLPAAERLELHLTGVARTYSYTFHQQAASQNGYSVLQRGERTLFTVSQTPVRPIHFYLAWFLLLLLRSLGTTTFTQSNRLL